MGGPLCLKELGQVRKRQRGETIGVGGILKEAGMDKPHLKGTFQGREAAILSKASGSSDETRWESVLVLTRKPLCRRLLAWVELFASLQIHESGKGVGRAKRWEFM